MHDVLSLPACASGGKATVKRSDGDEGVNVDNGTCVLHEYGKRRYAPPAATTFFPGLGPPRSPALEGDASRPHPGSEGEGSGGANVTRGSECGGWERGRRCGCGRRARAYRRCTEPAQRREGPGQVVVCRNVLDARRSKGKEIPPLAGARAAGHLVKSSSEPHSPRPSSSTPSGICTILAFGGGGVLKRKLERCEATSKDGPSGSIQSFTSLRPSRSRRPARRKK
ncbi:hypothetical protein FB451DRAFT_445781 [Mycena latifolia]|nr:hypothetical protein FB451DRAFT_445781 [Mycena latifolia]